MHKEVRYSALITGATGDIGMAIVNKLINDGYFIVALGRNVEKGKVLIDKYGSDNILFKAIDFNKEYDLSTVFLSDVFAKYSLHTVIACAGILTMYPIEQIPLNNWYEAININLTSVFFIFQESIKLMFKKGHGNLIAIGSRWGESGAKYAAAYSATKSALRGFIKSLQYELCNTGIRPILISPGSVAGRMSSSVNIDSSQEYITPSEIANLISYITSTSENVIFDEIKIKAYHYDLNN